MTTLIFILGLVCGFVPALIYALHQRKQKLLWQLQALEFPDADCSDGQPCSTCPERTECARTGCLRQSP